MMQDDELPRRDDPLSLLEREDLQPLSQDELAERIDRLRTEIARIEAHAAATAAHRAAADALFGGRG